MLRSPLLTAFLVLSGLACASTSAAEDAVGSPGPRADFRWQKTLGRPTRLEVHDQNGAIRVEPSSASGSLEIVAVKRGRDAAGVSVQVREESEGLIVACALWPGQSSCTTRPSGAVDKLDAQVEFVLRVPASVVHLDAETMNGAVVVRSPGGGLRLRTMNGAIDATTSGPIDAETMNGSITAHVTARGNAAHLATKNGNVEIFLPADLDADVAASTMRGNITSAFGPVPRPAFPGIPNAARFKIGAGGVAVTVATLNGNVRLQRS